MHPAITAKRDEIIVACKRFNVSRLYLFGSASRGVDFDSARSDADFLVEFPENSRHDPYLDLKEALETILGSQVDLVDRRALDTSRNYIRRNAILSTAEPIYVA